MPIFIRGGFYTPAKVNTPPAVKPKETPIVKQEPKILPQASPESQIAHAKGASDHASGKADEVKQRSVVAKQQLNYKLGDSSSKVGSQAKYGPTADLDAKQQSKLQKHYGADKSSNPLERFTQYDAKHSTYVSAAEKSGRKLTTQEQTAKSTGKNAPKSSIDHIIASGTGQNILNEQTLQFNKGKKMAGANLKTATADPAKVSDKEIAQAQSQVRAGVAKQAASVGRMQGYSRAILNERKGEVADVVGKRGEMMKKTVTAFEGDTPQKRIGAYKDVLKQTFDSPGNLRVGDSSANTKISTGFDAPLNSKGKPTKQSERLLDAHQTYAPDRLLTDKRLFTKDESGNILSSSQKAPKNKS